MNLYEANSIICGFSFGSGFFTRTQRYEMLLLNPLLNLNIF